MKENIEHSIRPNLAEMKEEILTHIGKPQHLESMYQNDKTVFKQAFNLAFADLQDNTIAQVWHARFNHVTQADKPGSQKEWPLIAAAILVAGFIAKIPGFTGQEVDLFYQRNVGFIVFPLMAAYFAWKTTFSTTKWLLVIATFLIAAFYINILPANVSSDTLMLACMHLPLLLWAVVGFTFIGGKLDKVSRRLDFLRFNGDLLVMAAILCIAGFILTAVTFGLFELIEVNLAYVFENYIAVWGIPAVPIVAGYLVLTHPQLVNKISPLIARIFTPLVLVTLVAYLVAVFITGKDPYNNREFLLIFNVMLIGVMAIILFSSTEILKKTGSKLEKILLASLSAVTIFVNGIALSAILFRISEWGLTPNRLAVLGANVLILVHLLLVSYGLFNSIKDKDGLENVEKTIASYLPVYIIWATVVVFLFPLVFGFK